VWKCKARTPSLTENGVWAGNGNEDNLEGHGTGRRNPIHIRGGMFRGEGWGETEVNAKKKVQQTF